MFVYFSAKGEIRETFVPSGENKSGDLLQLALQLLVLRHDGNLGLQVTVNRAVTEIGRANEGEARPLLPPQVIPQTCKERRSCFRAAHGFLPAHTPQLKNNEGIKLKRMQESPSADPKPQGMSEGVSVSLSWLQNPDTLTLNTTRHRAEQGDKHKKLQLYFDYNRDVWVSDPAGITDSLSQKKTEVKGAVCDIHIIRL